ncbi:LysR substrate-binding domain-containing protein [Psychromarinibacter sp. C21-152]|uniref:LysR substrate-binding domain-containing protein n=1 Tax=Psychromarinibacter sediminicola TaxID=3033385 RepID=A0AAE3T833_9RHOB|nr:LysR substrate-binding domain-containing protein [Psychromarinibacter sediminicola]MDF0600832.1 LysR substrate-binding domain-containing protein [Psychromarinibacter sediminicola]
MSSSRIRMRHLRCFLAVARLGSATRAADALGTVQPSVSRSLREFEEEMGATLFERTATGLELNEAGRTLFSYVSAGLGQVDRGIDTMRGQLRAEKVVVFAMPNVVRVVMPGAVRRFKALYPEIDVELDTVASGRSADRLRDGMIDFAFGRLQSPERMAGLNFEHLYSEPLAFFVRAGHPLIGTPDIDISDIDRYSVVIPSTNTIIRDEIDRFVIGQGISRFSNLIETVSFEFARNYLQTTDAIVCLPLGGFRREMELGRVAALDFGAPQLMGAVGITSLADQQLSAPAQLMVQTIRDEVKALGLS